MNDDSLLMKACMEGNEDCVRLLLKYVQMLILRVIIRVIQF